MAIDLLHVDAEGYDFEILKQVDFGASWAPSFIIFEREHFDREMYRQAMHMLRTAGYRCVDVWPDTLAYCRGRPPGQRPHRPVSWGTMTPRPAACRLPP